MSELNPLKEVKVETFAEDGYGLGRFCLPPHSQVSVPYTMPNDRVLVSLAAGENSAELQSILVPSPQRIAPKCRHFGVCKGCLWQHMPYEQQLFEKQKRLQIEFTKNFPEKNLPFHSIIPSESEWHYLNKIDLVFANDSEDNPLLGFHKLYPKGNVFNVEECPIGMPWFMDAARAVSAWWRSGTLEPYQHDTDRGELRSLTLRDGLPGGDRLVILTVSGNPDYALKRRELDGFVNSLRQAVEPLGSEAQLSIFLCIYQKIKGKASQIYEMQLYGPDTLRVALKITPQFPRESFFLNLSISPSVFFQSNRYVGEKFFSRLIDLADIPANQIIYDLYCSSGAAGLCLGREAKEIVSIDGSPEALLDVKKNASDHGMTQVSTLCGSVRSCLKKIRDQRLHSFPTVVCLAAPSLGIDDEVLEQLLTFAPQTVLYLSENPSTLAQHAVQFAASGYAIEAIQPFDFYPQTPRFQTLIKLQQR